MIYKYANAKGDRTVGDIECRPMKSAHIKIKKIDHHSKTNPVDQVADGASENQGKRCGQQGVFGWRFFIKINNDTDCQRRYKKKDNAAQDGAQIRQQSKGSARIEDVGDVKEAFYDRYGLIERQVSQDETFAELIQQDNNPADNHQFDIFVFQHLFSVVLVLVLVIVLE